MPDSHCLGRQRQSTYTTSGVCQRSNLMSSGKTRQCEDSACHPHNLADRQGNFQMTSFCIIVCIQILWTMDRSCFSRMPWWCIPASSLSEDAEVSSDVYSGLLYMLWVSSDVLRFSGAVLSESCHPRGTILRMTSKPHCCMSTCSSAGLGADTEG